MSNSEGRSRMKKVFGLLVLIGIVFVGCMEKKQTEVEKVSPLIKPPELTVSYNSKSIRAIQGTCSWYVENGDGTLSGFEADSVSPPELVNSQTDFLNVPSKASIILEFKNEPKAYEVYIWEGNDQTTKLKLQKNEVIVVPKKKGLVVYEVYAKWKEGNAHYAFSVIVE
jgi:hypothetical protein